MAPFKRILQMFTKSIHWQAPCIIWSNVLKYWALKVRKQPMYSPPMCITKHRKDGAWWRIMRVQVRLMRLQKFPLPHQYFIERLRSTFMVTRRPFANHLVGKVVTQV
jgi:hypothetical protein